MSSDFVRVWDRKRVNAKGSKLTSAKLPPNMKLQVSAVVEKIDMWGRGQGDAKVFLLQSSGQAHTSSVCVFLQRSNSIMRLNMFYRWQK